MDVSCRGNWWIAAFCAAADTFRHRHSRPKCPVHFGWLGHWTGGTFRLAYFLRLQGVYGARSSRAHHRQRHQPRVPLWLSARRRFLGLAVVAHHHRIRHGGDSFHFVPETKVAGLHRVSLCLLRRHWRFHDHSLVLGFRGRGHYWNDHWNGGGEMLWKKPGTREQLCACGMKLENIQQRISHAQGLATREGKLRRRALNLDVDALAYSDGYCQTQSPLSLSTEPLFVRITRPPSSFSFQPTEYRTNCCAFVRR